jgi:hypothetical protein
MGKIGSRNIKRHFIDPSEKFQTQQSSRGLFVVFRPYSLMFLRFDGEERNSKMKIVYVLVSSFSCLKINSKVRVGAGLTA